MVAVLVATMKDFRCQSPEDDDFIPFDPWDDPSVAPPAAPSSSADESDPRDEQPTGTWAAAAKEFRESMPEPAMTFVDETNAMEETGTVGKVRVPFVASSSNDCLGLLQSQYRFVDVTAKVQSVEKRKAEEEAAAAEGKALCA